MNYLETPAGRRLAYVKTAATAGGAGLPGVVFLGGYRSDMEGTKALFLEEQCRARGQAFVRFDYSGHGRSEGDFADGTIGAWTQDALAVIDALTGDGPLILAGSSMGGWIALLCALQRPARVRGLIGLAAAPDFTLWIEDALTDDYRRQLAAKGYFEEANDYSDQPYVFTRALLEDGRKHALLAGGVEIPLDIPVRLIQGMRDADVEWQTAHRIRNALRGRDCEVFLIEDGDHRLSREPDLGLLGRVLADLNGIV